MQREAPAHRGHEEKRVSRHRSHGPLDLSGERIVHGGARGGIAGASGDLGDQGVLPAGRWVRILVYNMVAAGFDVPDDQIHHLLRIVSLDQSHVDRRGGAGRDGVRGLFSDTTARHPPYFEGWLGETFQLTCWAPSR